MKSRYFVLQELVPPAIFETRALSAWELLDPRLLRALDGLRERFGPIIVNDWHTGGKYKESGYRVADSKTGAALSQHKMGRAADCKFVTTTPAKVYDYILAHPDEFPEITCLENIEKTPSWLHVDVRNCTRIKIVNP